MGRRRLDWAKPVARERGFVGGVPDTFVIRHGVTAGELASTVYAYPTFASDIKFMV